MRIYDVARNIYHSIRKKTPYCRAKKMGYDNNSRIEENCNISDLKLEGNNHIGPRCHVYHTSMGFGSGISRDSIIDSYKIGRFSTFGPDVKTVTGEHPTDCVVSTYPAFYSARAQMGFTYVSKTCFDEFAYADFQNKYKVVVGNDVWVGSYVRILEGITIGDGAIVAGGALVTKDVPPYAIVGGVPAKIIKYRFSEEQISYLLNFRWWDKGEEWWKEHADSFVNIDTFIAENRKKIK